MTPGELFGFVALMALGLILLFAIRVRLEGLQSRIAAVTRVEAKLDLLLKQANIKFDPFAHVSDLGDRETVIAYVLSTGILHSDNRVLGLGPRAEFTFGRRHFGDLVVSFSSPMLPSVMHGHSELGTVHPLALTSVEHRRSVRAMRRGPRALCRPLAGSAP
jgi:hypothetical protein